MHIGSKISNITYYHDNVVPTHVFVINDITSVAIHVVYEALDTRNVGIIKINTQIVVICK